MARDDGRCLRRISGALHQAHFATLWPAPRISRTPLRVVPFLCANQRALQSPEQV